MKSYSRSPQETKHIRAALRPDVQQLVTALIAEAPKTGDAHAYRVYSHAKKQISRAIGWDAGERCDVQQYDMAIAAYARACL